MFKISVRRVHEPRGKLNVVDKQETIDLIEGGVECRSYDSITVLSTWELTPVSMRYSQGDGVHTPLSWLILYPHSGVVSVSVYVYVLLCYLGLPVARSCAVWDNKNKNDVCTRTIPAGLKYPPPSKTISSITWFEA